VIASVGSFPAPPGNGIHIGRFELRAYGLMIALGVLAAVSFAQHRWAARGGRREDITALAVWAVPAGLIGALPRGHKPISPNSASAPTIATTTTVQRTANRCSTTFTGAPPRWCTAGVTRYALPTPRARTP